MDNKKRMKTESGASLPASYKTDAYSKWVKKNKVQLPRVGEQELAQEKVKPIVGTIRWKQRYRHNGDSNSNSNANGNGNRNSVGGSGGGGGAKTRKNELKNRDQILKNRKNLNKRREKNARPSKKKSSR